MQNLNHSTTMLIGIGNNGRSDDGLAWAMVELIDKTGHFKGETRLRYQLQVEDAEMVSQYNTIIFVDASKEGLENGYKWSACKPARTFSFTSHELTPQTILYICRDLYQRRPKAFILAIGGEAWDLQIGLSATAEMNLQKAIAFAEEELRLF